MTPWPHQLRAIDDVLDAIRRGHRRICVTSPTGGGKSWIMLELARRFLDKNAKVSLYTNRKLLLEQISNVLSTAGVFHGIRAAGHEDEREHDFQVSSIQTENARTIKRKTWKLHEAQLVLIDEAHLQTGDVAMALLEAHRQAGAAVVGFTATPIDLSSVYDHLIVAGTTSELRSCGALVPATHFGPDEPDLRAFKKLQAKLEAGDNPSEAMVRSAMMTPSLFGRVWEWFDKLNPERQPTILFSPGVQESIWFAEKFTEKGVRAAHIDGSDVWIDGRLEPSSQSLRKHVLEGSKNGDIVVLCNRFVLREGIDCPWLKHGIFATMFGSLQSYLQSGGRLLRAHPGLDSVTIQDHGGNYWRHGSLNADRVWELSHSANRIAAQRGMEMRANPSLQPGRCPQCAKVIFGSRCRCGWEARPGEKRSRPVVSTDGKLREMVGDPYSPRRVYQGRDAAFLWERMYHRAKSQKWDATFRQAEALFAYENHSWPDHDLPLMPTTEEDWFRKVRDVPADSLVPK